MALKIKMNESYDLDILKTALENVGFDTSKLRKYGSDFEGPLFHRNGVELYVCIYDDSCDITELDITSIVKASQSVMWLHPEEDFAHLPYSSADDLALRLKGIAEAMAVVANIYKR